MMKAADTQIIESVTTWHVPPEDQGQIIEVAYGMAEDGIVVERTIDRSDSTMTYAIGEVDGPFEPWHEAPAFSARAAV